MTTLPRNRETIPTFVSKTAFWGVNDSRNRKSCTRSQVMNSHHINVFPHGGQLYIRKSDKRTLETRKRAVWGLSAAVFIFALVSAGIALSLIWAYSSSSLSLLSLSFALFSLMFVIRGRVLSRSHTIAEAGMDGIPSEIPEMVEIDDGWASRVLK
jgi:hypothetical protein